MSLALDNVSYTCYDALTKLGKGGMLMKKRVRKGTALPQWLQKEASVLLRSLTTREEKVLRMHFGMLTPAEKERLQELTRIRAEAEREFNALLQQRVGNLRHPSRSKKLKTFLLETK